MGTWAFLMNMNAAIPLCQVALVPYVSMGVKERAKIALQMMDRYPLADNVLMGVGDASVEGADEAGQE